jgi:4-oxalocrotonate tautomerase
VPVIHVSLAAGRAPERLHALGAALTDAAVRALDVPPGTVRVVLTEHDPEHWFVGGESLARLRGSGQR